MKRTAEQNEILNALSSAHASYAVERSIIRDKIQKSFEAQLYELKLQKASLMIRGLDAGVPKSALGRAIGTADLKTIQEYLDLGRTMVPESTMPTERFAGSVYMRNAGFFLFATVTDRDAPRTSTVQGDIVEGSVFKLAWSAAAKRYTADPVALDGMDENTDAKAWLIKEWAPEYYEKAIGKKGDDA